MRAFFAVAVEAALKEGAGRLIEELGRTGADFKWVDPGQLHLTLSFLGEVAESKVPTLAGALEEAVGSRPAFDLVFDRWGAFESWDYPRVIWLGASQGEEELKALAEDLSKALARAHLLPIGPSGREFKTHLTLGRMRSPSRLDPLKALMKNPPSLEGLRTKVESLVLFKSELGPKGPSYTVLNSAGLPRP
ncbi:MAG: RNA 2',3'-cyclic phosphodiesterase [Elusimicrobia bacterium]|nr:RNA 2',3'-cyclic phosphodiesterase [Elusimicrobiota bacterium]